MEAPDPGLFFTGVVAAVAGFLTWLGQKSKGAKEEPAVATLRGSVLMDSEAMNPLRKDIVDLRVAVERLSEIYLEERKDREADDAKREIRTEIEAERRMNQLTEQLAELLKQKNAAP